MAKFKDKMKSIYDEEKKLKANQKKDRDITEKKSGEWSSPEMERRQKRMAQDEKEEKSISNKNSNSLSRGLKGFVVGANAMNAKDAEERNKREAVRNKRESEIVKKRKRRAVK